MHHLLGRALAASVALSALLAGPAAALESESPLGSNVPLTFSPPAVSPGFAGVAVPAAAGFPDRPSAPEIDGYGTQDEEFHCDPTAKPGAVALAEMVGAALQTEWGIERACGAGGYGTSRHKMGLAIDVMLDSGTEDGRADADALIGWLLAPDTAGNANARARRLGVTQIIWSDRIWQATHRGGPRPHLGHLHLERVPPPDRVRQRHVPAPRPRPPQPVGGRRCRADHVVDVRAAAGSGPAAGSDPAAGSGP